jgi:hypothetical protein
MRQIVLDTETTGLSAEAGDRIIEIGCVELFNRKLTGRTFHYYLNPERESHEDALKVHGISNEFLQDKPKFVEIFEEFLEFVRDAELIIHETVDNKYTSATLLLFDVLIYKDIVCHLQFLHNELDTSQYPERYGNHIENRDSMINFSIVGRNAKGEQRTRYYEWDIINCERLAIAEKINLFFPDVSAQAGGETGIDIIPKNKDKRQVVQYMQKERVWFFGDRLDCGGNDKPLADALIALDNNSTVFHVISWQDTWDILMNIAVTDYNK